LLDTDPSSPLSPSFLRGLGDGTFAAATEAPGGENGPDGNALVGIAQLDRDIALEVVFTDGIGNFFVESGDMDAPRQPFESAPSILGFGDINDDDIDDYVRINIDGKFQGDYTLMISTP
jgi:hypothetical protein